MTVTHPSSVNMLLHFLTVHCTQYAPFSALLNLYLLWFPLASTNTTFMLWKQSVTFISAFKLSESQKIIIADPWPIPPFYLQAFTTLLTVPQVSLSLSQSHYLFNFLSQMLNLTWSFPLFFSLCLFFPEALLVFSLFLYVFSSCLSIFLELLLSVSLSLSLSLCLLFFWSCSGRFLSNSLCLLYCLSISIFLSSSCPCLSKSLSLSLCLFLLSV